MMMMMWHFCCCFSFCLMEPSLPCHLMISTPNNNISWQPQPQLCLLKRHRFLIFLSLSDNQLSLAGKLAVVAVCFVGSNNNDNNKKESGVLFVESKGRRSTTNIVAAAKLIVYGIIQIRYSLF